MGCDDQHSVNASASHIVLYQGIFRARICKGNLRGAYGCRPGGPLGVLSASFYTSKGEGPVECPAGNVTSQQDSRIHAPQIWAQSRCLKPQGWSITALHTSSAPTNIRHVKFIIQQFILHNSFISPATTIPVPPTKARPTCTHYSQKQD